MVDKVLSSRRIRDMKEIFEKLNLVDQEVLSKLGIYGGGNKWDWGTGKTIPNSAFNKYVAVCDAMLSRMKKSNLRVKAAQEKKKT